MSDRELRELERRWRETRQSEDEVRWLQARLRAGTLGRARLWIAAELGHAPARRALELDQAPLPLARTLETLLAGGEQAVRAALAAARCALDPEEESQADYEEAAAAAADWLACPCAEHAARALRLRGDLSHRAHVAAWSVGLAQRDAQPLTPAPAGYWDTASSYDPWTADRDRAVARLLAASQALPEGGERLLQALRTELIPWALGLPAD